MPRHDSHVLGAALVVARKGVLLLFAFLLVLDLHVEDHLFAGREELLLRLLHVCIFELRIDQILCIFDRRSVLQSRLMPLRVPRIEIVLRKVLAKQAL